jgi:hypothetical protein
MPGAGEDRAEASSKMRLDYSGLKRQHMAARSEKERQALDADFRREIEARGTALAHVAPNLKALEQFQAVKVLPRCRPPVLSRCLCPEFGAAGWRATWAPTCRLDFQRAMSVDFFPVTSVVGKAMSVACVLMHLRSQLCEKQVSFTVEDDQRHEALHDAQARERQQEEELEGARAEAKAAARAFNEVQQKRYDAFTSAFEHIASVIDPIFKDLTRSRCARSFSPPCRTPGSTMTPSRCQKRTDADEMRCVFLPGTV